MNENIRNHLLGLFVLTRHVPLLTVSVILSVFWVRACPSPLPLARCQPGELATYTNGGDQICTTLAALLPDCTGLANGGKLVRRGNLIACVADEVMPAAGFNAPAGCMYMEQQRGRLYQMYCSVPLPEAVHLAPMLPPPAPDPKAEKKP